jgi:hypothetical protein
VKSKVNLKSDLPILGAEYKEAKAIDQVEVTAALYSAKSGPLYAARLRKIKKRMTDGLKAAKKADSHTGRYQLLTSTLPLFDQYARHRIVAMRLGVDSIPELSASESDISNRILILEKAADSIEFAAQLIAKKIDTALGNIYVYPPMLRDCREVTQFAAAVRDHVANHFRTVSTPDLAEYLMLGRYEKLTQRINLSYTLYKMSENAVSGAVVQTTPKAFADYLIEPGTKPLDDLLYTELAVLYSMATVMMC